MFPSALGIRVHPCLSVVNFPFEQRLRLSFPPEHPLQPSAVGIGSWNPVFLQLEKRSETLENLFARRTERRPVGIGNHVVHREKLCVGFEPTVGSMHVFVPTIRIDRAKQCVFEQPIKWLSRSVCEEICFSEFRV